MLYISSFTAHFPPLLSQTLFLKGASTELAEHRKEGERDAKGSEQKLLVSKAKCMWRREKKHFSKGRAAKERKSKCTTQVISNQG